MPLPEIQDDTVVQLRQLLADPGIEAMTMPVLFWHGLAAQVQQWLLPDAPPARVIGPRGVI